MVLDPSFLLGRKLAGMVGREPLGVRMGIQTALRHGVSQLLAHVSASSSGTASAK